MTPLRDDTGRYPSFAYCGGYPLYYVTADGGVLCPGCANTPEVSAADSDDPQLLVIAADVHYEGEPVVCDHCGAEIESAYGIPEGA